MGPSRRLDGDRAGPGPRPALPRDRPARGRGARARSARRSRRPWRWPASSRVSPTSIAASSRRPRRGTRRPQCGGGVVAIEDWRDGSTPTSCKARSARVRACPIRRSCRWRSRGRRGSRSRRSWPTRTCPVATSFATSSSSSICSARSPRWRRSTRPVGLPRRPRERLFRGVVAVSSAVARRRDRRRAADPVTIEKGRVVGRARDVARRRRDRAFRRRSASGGRAARRTGEPVPTLGLLGGDLCRTVGGQGDEARLPRPGRDAAARRPRLRAHRRTSALVRRPPGGPPLLVAGRGRSWR